jgi:release factor glutamine methyltransferase
MKALVSGNDGLEDIRLIISQSPQYLNKGGLLLLEHGYDQKDLIVNLMKESFKSVRSFTDLNKVDRAILAELR